MFKDRTTWNNDNDLFWGERIPGEELKRREVTFRAADQLAVFGRLYRHFKKELEKSSSFLHVPCGTLYFVAVLSAFLFQVLQSQLMIFKRFFICALALYDLINLVTMLIKSAVSDFIVIKHMFKIFI